MGYIFTIGEAVLKTNKEEERVYIDVEPMTVDDAPAFEKYLDKKNQYYSSYTLWSAFCKSVKLEELFYDEDEETVLLTERHKREIDKTHKNYLKKHSNSINSLWVVRLEWLKFWVDWALKNCNIPAFKNL